MIIIPAIDIIQGKCVRLVQGDYSRGTEYSLSPEEAAARWEKLGAKFIHLVDLDGAKAGHPVNLDTVRNICRKTGVPCELGGGIRTIKDAEDAFNAGVSRIILGTVAVENMEIASEMASCFGQDKVVIGIDARDGKVAVKGWIVDSGMDVATISSGLMASGIRRFIYTDISRDGSLSGPNFNAIRQFCDTVPECSVIASGGVGSEEDVLKLKELARASRNVEGVIIGKALYENRINLERINSLL